jgi:AcrR family transcriptional regulator
MDETDSDLPASVELLWGLRDRSRRGGPKPTLSLDRIVSAAIELADAGGLAAVSMSRLADKLGFTTMSLYRYIASKEELVLLMVDASIGPLPQIDASGGWRERAEAWSRELLAFYRTHAWILEVPISGLPAGPRQLLWFDRGLAALEDTRLTEGEKASSVLLLAMYSRTQAALGTDLVRAAQLAKEAGGEPRPWSQVLTRLIDPERYPAVSRAVRAGVFDAPGGEEDIDDEFDFGLQRVLDGIEALDKSRRPPEHSPPPKFSADSPGYPSG